MSLDCENMSTVSTANFQARYLFQPTLSWVYVTIECPSVRPSGCPSCRLTTAAAYGGYAAERYLAGDFDR